jgi:hypothetical protein
MDNLNLLRRMPMIPPLNPRTTAMNSMPIIKVQLSVKLLIISLKRIIPMALIAPESLSLSGRSR